MTTPKVSTYQNKFKKVYLTNSNASKSPKKSKSKAEDINSSLVKKLLWR